MASPRVVRRAIVYKGAVAAATLTRTSGGVQFGYLPEYSGPAVASTLPPGATFDGHAGALPPFFSGLLPEGRRLNALRRSVKTSADDELALILAIGEDLVGDVSVVPDGVGLHPVEPTVSGLGELSRLRFADLLAEQGFTDRIGIAGAQDKLSAGMITFPLRMGSGPAIVKLDPPDYPDVVVNENFFLGIARNLKLPVVASELVHDSEGRPGLVVKRFDRVAAANGTIVRRAVEDATQLLGLYPADKYSVTSEEMVQAVAQVCAARLVGARAGFQQILLAWLTGNGDLHAKNISVLQEASGEWRVAPVYDVPCTLPYGDVTMALTVQGADRGLTRRRMLGLAAAIGLPRSATERAIEEVLTATDGMLNHLEAGALPWNRNLLLNVVRQLKRRRRDLEATAG